MAGNAMSRRASYMYGNLLPPDPKGQVGAGLGTTTSAGTVTLIPPTDIITETGQKETIDGLTYEFLMAPGSEAPAEMLWYIEEKKAIADRRGRDPHAAQHLLAARRQDPRAAALVEVPQPGADDVGRRGRGDVRPAPLADLGQRRTSSSSWRSSATSTATSTTRRCAWLNQGMTMREIAEQFKLPPSLATLLGQPRLLRLGLPQRRRHLRALSRLVRRQPGDAARAAAGRGQREVRRVHGRRRRGAGEGARRPTTRATTAGWPRS